MQSLLSLIRSTAIGNGSLTVLVEDRIYPAELALIENPTFPCVNFRIDGGPPADRDIPKIVYPNIQFWAWSTISYAQTHQVYEVVFDIFERQNLTSSDIYALFHESSGRAEIYDPISKAYGISARWSVHITNRT